MSVTLAPDAAVVPARPVPAAATDAMWPLWCALGSSLAAAFGVHWDIAWHRSIGRDSFWTPPQVAIYSAAVLAAVAALARILPAMFGRDRSLCWLDARAPRARQTVVLALEAVGPDELVDHAHHHGMMFPPLIRFPCEFPRAGAHRLFVQVKIAGRIETAAWDVDMAG